MKCFVIVSLLVTLFASCGQVDSASSLERKQHNRGNDNNRAPAPRSYANQEGMYPRSPEGSMTPGSTCNSGHRRFGVQMCDRSVSGSEKDRIFAAYDRVFGFHTLSMPRNQFKVDHLIPLCLGGGNDDSNLWPQHESIYTLTDPIEPYLCGLLSARKMGQGEAIRIVREIKQAPETTAARMVEIEQRTHVRPAGK